MTEVSKSVCSNSAADFLCTARRRRVVVAVLAGFAMLASSIQGANAAATPVTNIDEPGRIPYSSFQSVSPGQTVIAFPVVPAGHRLVIQHVSANLGFQSRVNNQVEVFVAANGGFSSFLPQFSASLTGFDQQVQLYINGGAAPEVIVLADSGFTRNRRALSHRKNLKPSCGQRHIAQKHSRGRHALCARTTVKQGLAIFNMPSPSPS